MEYIHDPSTVAYVLPPGLLKVRPDPIRIMCERPAISITLYQTLKKPFWSTFGKINTQQIGVDVDSQTLLDLYFKTLGSCAYLRQKNAILSML